MLEMVNKRLEEQTKDIIDSINYAKRIQQVMFPDENSLEEIFPENFMFFQPRDIVSWDFYLVFKKDEKKIFILGDSTWHWVNWALISMIAMTLLTEIIQTKWIVDPKDIINEMDNQLSKYFHWISDWVALSILTIYEEENNKKKVEFVGAGQNIYIKENGSFQTYKGDKKHLNAKYKKDLTFNKNVFFLDDNAIILITTDWLNDQFHYDAEGNEIKTRKKNGQESIQKFYKKLNEILQQVEDNCWVYDLGKKIKNEINEWIAWWEQIDDISFFIMKT